MTKPSQLDREIDEALSRSPTEDIHITTDTTTLARAMSAVGGEEFATIAAWNSGTYPGTRIPLRKMTGREVVRVVGRRTSARVIDTDGGWIADRFGSLGARQVGALLALVPAKKS